MVVATPEAFAGTRTDSGYGLFVGGRDVGAAMGNVAYLMAGPNTDTGSCTNLAAVNHGGLTQVYLNGVAVASTGSNPTRGAAQIANYPDSVLTQLDVDGDGHVHALTDGLLMLRRMLGFSDSALKAGTKLGTRLDADVAAAIDRLKP